MKRLIFAAALLAALAPAARAATVGDPDLAALQVALRGHGFYRSTIDGVAGPKTLAAIRAFQAHAGVPRDGQAGPSTRLRLGPYDRHRLGDRIIARGMSGWDVAAAQFRLAWRGFPSGRFDAVFGERVERAVRRFQLWAGIPATGQIGSATLSALQAPPAAVPLRLQWPLRLPVTERFGPRGDRFHTGIDMPATTGTRVAAAASGRVITAGWDPGGFGNVVLLEHAGGVRTLYAHLSEVHAVPGAWATAGQIIGHVGSTGHSTGPHLHFEVRLGDAAVDPLLTLSAR